MNCSDKRNFVGAPVQRKTKKGTNKTTYYYPPTASARGHLRTEEEVCIPCECVILISRLVHEIGS
jgi:hypothetical protein